MAARKTPAERALADIEKAIKASTTAAEKADTAQKKADELTEVANRAEREVIWMAHHPDVPAGFNLDEFRRSLEAPFGEENAADDEPFEETDLKPVIEQKEQVVKELVTEPEFEKDVDPVEEPSEPDAPAIDAADEDDDPWAGE